MSPEKFHSRMSWLIRSNYKIISLDEAVKNLDSGAWPPHSTVLTIDDGWYGSYQYMLPILEHYSLPATMYVYTGAVDSQRPLLNIMVPALIHLSSQTRLRLEFTDTSGTIDLDLSTEAAKRESTSKIMDILLNYRSGREEECAQQIALKLGFDYSNLAATRQFSFMTYEEISDANRRGVDIQLHTHSHHVGTDAPADLKVEIALNREKLAPYVCSSLRHFCYPSGVNSPAMHEHLRECSIESATLVDSGFVALGTNRYALNRILDGEDTTQVEFEAELSGFLEIWRSAKRAIKPSRSDA